MKILLIHPPWLRFFGNGLKVPPMALNCIASYIKRELPEHTIDVYNVDHSNNSNLTFNSYTCAVNHEKYLRRLSNFDDIIWREVKDVINNYNPDVVGISSMTASYISALNISRIAKQINPKSTIIFGGKHPTALPQDTLKNNFIDFVVIGEGEVTFKELIMNLSHPEKVKGIAYRTRGGEIFVTPHRPYIANIDELPIPVFESSINRYDYENNDNSQSSTWQIVSVRGCPFQCIYCASDKAVRLRSVAGVIDEISYIKKRFNISHFSFEDDSFTLDRKRSLDLCKQLKYIGVSWMCNTRIDLIDEDLVLMMRQSGCTSVSIGIETGSPKSREIINKKIKYGDILKAINIFKKYGILVNGYFMIGFPWEDKGDMDSTLNLIKALPVDDFQLNIATPLPGTKLFQNLVDAGRITIDNEDWSRYHQGSPYMNFSKYSDAEWRDMIIAYSHSALLIWRWRIIKKVLKLFLNDPLTMSTKIKNIGLRGLGWVKAQRLHSSYHR